jgi:hypothetical protein
MTAQVDDKPTEDKGRVDDNPKRHHFSVVVDVQEMYRRMWE